MENQCINFFYYGEGNNLYFNITKNNTKSKAIKWNVHDIVLP